MTTPALAEPFIAAGAAVGFIRWSLLFFKGAHGLVVPPRHWYFFRTEKGKAPAAMSGRKLYMLGGYHQAKGNPIFILRPPLTNL